MLSRLALLLVLLVLPVSGCGTNQKDQYAKDFQKVAQNFRDSVEKAGKQVQSGDSLKERVPALRSFKASVDKLASDLSKLDPPSDVKRTNDEAVRQLQTLSSDLSDYERAAVASDQTEAARVVPKLQADQTLLQKTLDDLDKKVSG